MAVGWNTFEKLERPTVYYGLSPEALWLSASAGEGASVTYPTSRTWSNTVIIEGLFPATTYCEYLYASHLIVEFKLTSTVNRL
jgi:hypothetical protein